MGMPTPPASSGDFLLQQCWLHHLVLAADGLAYDQNAAPVALGLRQTLWHFKLSNTMVFESANHMHRFRQLFNREHNMALPR